ncbi:hypothetical protein QR685DRAFT_574457 [Neurospora intermedia]|uniref:Uncharacterized protein n=1 Tax=Neurospora intermedia TaxID=5142 RepID=A0ABR3D4Q8_NEUIN
MDIRMSQSSGWRKPFNSAVVSGTITDSSLCLLFCSVGGFFQLSCLQPTQPVSSFCRLISFSVEDGDSRNAEGGWRDNQEFGLANWRKSSVLVEWQKNGRGLAKPKRPEVSQTVSTAYKVA